MSSLSVYDVPFDEIEAAVMAWVSEALDLRHGEAGDPEGPLGAGPASDDIGEWRTFLFRIRQRSARTDELLSKVTQAKARAKRAQDGAAFAAELAYDEATRNHAARRTTEFTTGKERHADAALDSLEQRRVAHRASRLVSVTTEAYDVVNQVHWQFDGLRKDARSVLHALQFESSLEH